MADHNIDEIMAKQATIKKSQALGWASKAGATSEAEADKIYRSYQEMKQAAARMVQANQDNQNKK